MKIKRFVDKDMRTVLRRVREEQGPDAVILSNQRVDGGIEVIAAVDYDAALMQHAMGSNSIAAAEPAAPAADTAPDFADTAFADSFEAAERAARPQPARPAADVIVERATLAATRSDLASTPVDILLPAEDGEAGADDLQQFDALTGVAERESSLAAMRAEIGSLRGMLETQISGLLWKDNMRRTPQLAQVLRNLARLGLAPDIAGRIVKRLGPVANLKHIWQQPLAALGEEIPVVGDSLMTDGGVAALIGPTGVGKTTTIAKLAARYALRHGTEQVALVCADAYRIGAREHLTAFANILGVKVYAASDPEDLGRILGELRSKKLVLVDTEGVSQRDADLTRRLGEWRRNGKSVKFYLTLSASSQEAALDETIRCFRQVPLAGAIVTKVDEAGQLGCVLSALIRQQLPLAWITDGQHIPDDLHPAARRKFWLLKRAVDCIEASQPRIDERTMAENYGSVSAIHA